MQAPAAEYRSHPARGRPPDFSDPGVYFRSPARLASVSAGIATCAG